MSRGCTNRIAPPTMGDPVPFGTIRPVGPGSGSFLTMPRRALTQGLVLGVVLCVALLAGGAQGGEPGGSDAAAEGTAREPVPAAPAIQEATTLIAELYQEQYKAAQRDREARRALAAKLLETARGTAEDPVARYVLLRECARLAAEAGGAPAMQAAIEELGARYQVELPALYGEYLPIASKEAKEREEHAELSTLAGAAAIAAAAEDDFDQATDLLRLGSRHARRSRVKEAYTALKDTEDRIEEVEKIWKALKPRREALAMNLDDPAACLAMGRYHAFAKGDWATGLPLIAKGDNPEMAAAAKVDLQEPTEPEARRLLAETWWKAAEAAKDPISKKAMEARAAHYYAMVLPALSGLTAKLVEKRIEDAPTLAALRLKPTEVIIAGGWTDDCLLCVDMDHMEGEKLADLSGAGNHLELRGAKVVEDGFVGKALRVGPQAVAAAPLGDMPVGSEISVSLWVKPAAQQPTWGGLIGWGRRRGADSFIVGFHPQRNLGLATWANDWVDRGPTQTVLPPEAWSHVAVVLKGQAVQLYINGEAKSGTLPRAPDVVSLNLFLGATDWNGNRNAIGLLDEVIAWERALSAEEVAEIHALGEKKRSAAQAVARAKPGQGDPRADSRETRELVGDWLLTNDRNEQSWLVTFDEDGSIVSRNQRGRPHNQGTWRLTRKSLILQWERGGFIDIYARPVVEEGVEGRNNHGIALRLEKRD